MSLIKIYGENWDKVEKKILVQIFFLELNLSKFYPKKIGWYLDRRTWTELTDIDDVDLDEFVDEIDGWILDALKSIGCDSARSVLEISKTDLVKRTDLEIETIELILLIVFRQTVIHCTHKIQ